MATWFTVWTTEPVHARLFVLYLVAIFCFSVFRVVRLARFLYSTRTDAATNSISDRDDLRRIGLADARFRHLWYLRYADMQSIKTAVVFTLLLSVVIVTGGAGGAFANEFNNTNVPGSVALLKVGFVLCRRLATGVSVCAILYVIASSCEVVLMRRKADWSHALAVAKAGLSDFPR
jgi:hypothetical protein